MKKIFFLILILIFISAIGFSQNLINAAGDNEWFTSYNEALEHAQINDNVILMNFTGSDWCIWCMRLTDSVFSQNVFKEWQKNNATLLYLDFPQKKKLTTAQENHNQLLAQIYGIQGFPTIIVLDKTGKVIGRTGYESDVNVWLQEVKKYKAIYRSLVDSF